MNESKIAATHRLQAEGRWNEATLFKDQERKRLRNEGLSRGDAHDISWESMVAKFPPLTRAEHNDEPSAESFTIDNDEFEFSPDAEQTIEQIAADCRWIYRNIACKKVAKINALSAGAWGLLLWARQNQGKFYEQIVTRIASRKFGTSESESSPEPVGDTAEIQAMISAIGNSFKAQML